MFILVQGGGWLTDLVCVREWRDRESEKFFFEKRVFVFRGKVRIYGRLFAFYLFKWHVRYESDIAGFPSSRCWLELRLESPETILTPQKNRFTTTLRPYHRPLNFPIRFGCV